MHYGRKRFDQWYKVISVAFKKMGVDVEQHVPGESSKILFAEILNTYLKRCQV